MRPLGKHAVAALAASVLALPLASLGAQAARPLPSAVDSLYQASRQYLARGDTAAALDALEAVERRAPRFAVAFFDHGVILSRRSEMGLALDDVLRRRRAGDKLERALDLDPNNPLYLLELGRLRLKTPFLRIEAERLFARAQRAARARGDAHLLAVVEYELGLVSARRFNALRHRRILTGTTTSLDFEAAADDWHYIRDFLDQRTAPVADAGDLDRLKAEEHFHAALAADSSHAGAAADLLALLYESGRAAEMLPLATTLAHRQPRAPRTWMALGLALHARDRLDESAVAFDSALALLPASVRREMLDVSQWLRPDDAAHLASVPSAERQATEQAWWRSADPLALTRVNEARVTLLARVAYADLRFTSEEAQLPGWRTDRGQVWIRYGAPGVIATLAPETQDVNGAESMARVITVWWYPATSLRFVFRGPPAINAASFAGNFRAYADNARRIIPMNLDDAHATLRLDTVAVQVARFRGDSGTRVELFAQFPTDRMLSDVDLSPALVEGGFSFGDGAAQRTPQMARDSTRVAAGAAARPMRRSWARTVAPGREYAYRIEARQPDTGRGARGDGTIGVLPLGAAGAFDMSDLVVADRITVVGAPVARDAFRIDANPAMRFTARDTVALYWETYNAVARADGAARLRVRVTVRILSIDRGRSFSARVIGGMADAVGLSAVGDEQVSLTYERQVAAGAMVPHQLELSLGDAPAGRYSLALEVTDLSSGRATRTERTLTLERPTP
ncbi:MAG: GWxTD domain-containing protein [Gemmatimonadaceae bacterium]